MNEIKISLGAKYYNDNRFIRVIRFKNSETVRVKDLLTNKYELIKIKNLQEDYTLLLPDAAMAFNIVKNRDIQDVIVTCNRSKGDNIDGKPCPYLVLRQNILDLHANIIQKEKESNFVGCSVTLDNIPEGVDFNVLTACDGLLYYSIVYYYMEDKLDDILECIPKVSKYDDVLEELNKMYCEAKQIVPTPGIDGYCTTLKSLITTNNTMYDIRAGFGILSISSSKESIYNPSIPNKLNLKIREDIEIILGHRIIDEFIIDYKKDIDLDKLSNHILLCDSEENIYVLVYTKGDTITYDPDHDIIVNLDKSKYNNIL